MKSWIQGIAPLFNFFLESTCPLCQRSAPAFVCRDCERQLRRCQFQPRSPSSQDPLPVLPWGTYSGTLRQAIAALKYNHHPELAQPLGRWLGQTWLERQPRSTRAKPIVVPIPMHPAKQKLRGFNQADLLAEAFCEVTGLSLQTRGLQRVRDTEPQFTLSPADREANLNGAFAIGNPLKRPLPDGILLLDDIYTTGATVRSAMQVLRQHRVSVQGLVVLARTV